MTKIASVSTRILFHEPRKFGLCIATFGKESVFPVLLSDIAYAVSFRCAFSSLLPSSERLPCTGDSQMSNGETQSVQ
uniref:Uncharacterized protein n=1 Tax=Anguilla anguilla TaxID=7936 RepID=A0A0E9TE69_ANGAN